MAHKRSTATGRKLADMPKLPADSLGFGGGLPLGRVALCQAERSWLRRNAAALVLSPCELSWRAPLRQRPSAIHGLLLPTLGECAGFEPPGS